MQTIHLHIFKKVEIPSLHAKQRDVGRKFKAVITDGSDGYRIPEGVQLSVWYSGTSGEGHYSTIGEERSAFLVEGDTVVVELITQMLAYKGGGVLCLAMNGADGTQIGLWDIPYFVEALPGADSAAAQQHYDAFSELVADAMEAAARAQDAVETLSPDKTLSQAGKAADAAAVGTALAGKEPATESTTHPNCYYRTVNGEREWLNPPLVAGVEYRTTERYVGLPVYTKIIDIADVTTVNGYVNFGNVALLRHFSRVKMASQDAVFVLPYPADSDNNECFAFSQQSTVYFRGSGGFAKSCQWVIQAWYVKP